MSSRRTASEAVVAVQPTAGYGNEIDSYSHYQLHGGIRRRAVVAAIATTAAAVALVGCGSDDPATEAGEGADRPTVVVTTNILGDVLDELIGDQANLVTIMPVGADPHDFQASAREVDQLLRADALIVNGAGFEEGLLDLIESAHDEGVPIHDAIDSVDTIDFAEDEGHEDHEDDEDHENEHDHDHEGADPHFFTDPTRMGDAVRGIAAFLGNEVDDLDEGALDTAVNDYIAELDALDSEVEELVAAIPEEQRVLITNHEVFGYFADRYGFELVGVVIPGGTTAESASAGELAELATVIEAEDVPAIFADTSSSSDLAETLAAEVGDVSVVELYSESLGEPGSDGETYLDMVRTNAARISAALA